MLKSSLLEILRTFTKQELIKFEDFVRSPYFNKKENVTKLFLEIKKYAPEFSNENLEKEKVWQKIFPGTEYNYGIMKNLIFDLNKLAVKFIELENYSEKKFDSDINIMEQYLSRKLLNSFEKKFGDANKFLSMEKPSADLYYQNFILLKKQLGYFNDNYKVKDIMNFDFASLNENLHLHFFSSYFEINSIKADNELHRNTDSDKNYYSNILSVYEKSGFKNFYTEIYFHIFNIFYDPFNEDNYHSLKNLYYENFDKLTKNDQHSISVILIHFCVNNSNVGKSSFAKEKFQYHKMMDDHNLFTLKDMDSYVDGHLILTTVISACAAEEFDWCNGFIEKYRLKLDPDKRELFTNLAYTHLYFIKGGFEKALKYLSFCGNANGVDKINIKSYEIFLHYELGYYEELKNLIDSNRHYLRNNKIISDEFKIYYTNFIKAVNNLNEYRYKSKNGGASEFDLTELKNFVAENPMKNKGWLTKKLSELVNV